MRSVLPALDAVRFVAEAQQAERVGVLPFILDSRDPPLFPCLIYFTHFTLERIGAPISWLASVQGTSCFLMVLATIPALAFMTATMGTRAGAMGTAVFCCFPPLARLGADGLSESAAILFIASALWAGTRVFTSNHHVPLWATAAAAFLLFAWLSRWETIVLAPCLVAAIGFVLIRQLRTQQTIDVTRVSKPAAACGSFAIVLFLPVALIATHRRPASWSEAARQIVQGTPVREEAPLNASLEAINQAANFQSELRFDDGTLMVFGRKDHSTSTRAATALAKLREFAHETGHAFGLLVPPFVVLGMWNFRVRFRDNSQVFLILVAVTTIVMLACHVAMTGYLATRHFLILQLLALPWAGAGLCAVGIWTSRFSNHRHAQLVPALCACGVLVLFLAEPLHANQYAHRQAADWLALRTNGGAVLDTHGWSALTSQATTYRGETAPAAFNDPRLRFVILEAREININSPRGRSFRQVLEQAGEMAERFESASDPRNMVLVYHWSPLRWSPVADPISIAGRSDTARSDATHAR